LKLTKQTRRASVFRAGHCVPVARHFLGEGLLAPLRALAGGTGLDTAGATFLARACRALGADEGAILLAAEGLGAPAPGSLGGPVTGGTAPRTPAPTPSFLPGAHHGRHGAAGALGSRPRDAVVAATVMAAGRPRGSAAPNPELWCPMVVEGNRLGVLALRRDGPPPFDGEEQVLLEALTTGAGMAVDRLRFHRLWSQKLEQADAAHSQLLRYADDLRTTYSAERRRAEELRAALDAVQLAYIATVRALATAVEAKDAYTGGHLSRVTAYGIEVCKAIGGDLAELPGLQYAFLLHDLGKIGVPDAVLNKAGPLTDDEWALMRQHPAIGLRILEGVPHMDVVREVVYSHHENWDGGGYPEGLCGLAIPPVARVFAAVDAFDAITSDRPYRAGASLDEALGRLRAASGTQFAPDAVEAIHQVDPRRLAEIQATSRAATSRAGDG
jgi:HD-GYP domain-containing protein (c-di-GMP phosphodiesterase class II)